MSQFMDYSLCTATIKHGPLPLIPLSIFQTKKFPRKLCGPYEQNTRRLVQESPRDLKVPPVTCLRRIIIAKSGASRHQGTLPLHAAHEYLKLMALKTLFPLLLLPRNQIGA